MSDIHPNYIYVSYVDKIEFKDIELQLKVYKEHSLQVESFAVIAELPNRLSVENIHVLDKGAKIISIVDNMTAIYVVNMSSFGQGLFRTFKLLLGRLIGMNKVKIEVFKTRSEIETIKQLSCKNDFTLIASTC